MPIKRNVCEWLVTCVYIAYNFLKNVDGLYDFYTESDKNVDGSIKALKNVTGIGKNSKVFSIFDKYGTKTVKTIEDVVGLIGG